MIPFNVCCVTAHARLVVWMLKRAFYYIIASTAGVAWSVCLRMANPAHWLAFCLSSLVQCGLPVPERHGGWMWRGWYGQHAHRHHQGSAAASTLLRCLMRCLRLNKWCCAFPTCFLAPLAGNV